MNERDLRYLVAIVQSGSLRQASETLNITQPALTKCIDRLESEVNAKLFERKGRQIFPTDVGDVLVRRARNILRSIDETQREVSDYAEGRIGHIRVGAAATLTEFLMPSVVSRLITVSPGITIELIVGMSDVLRDALRQDKLDLVISPVVESNEFDCRPIINDQVVVVASRDHPLFNKTATLDDLRHYQWVLPPQSVALRKWLEQTFERLGLPAPRVKVEVNSLALMPKLIAKTALLSFVSRRTLSKKEASDQLAELHFEETTYNRQFGILTRHEGYVPAASQVLIDLLINDGPSLFGN
jgi:DNA-binding transcriptional LysR family regulator